jgi:transcriptional regulator with XRE-family HTH domain
MSMDSLTLTPLALGIALKRWRLLHRVKQTHAAEMFGVAQSTISRWEAGLQQMEPAERARVERLLAARLESAADRALERLVTESPREVHLVCDLTHRLHSSRRSFWAFIVALRNPGDRGARAFAGRSGLAQRACTGAVGVRQWCESFAACADSRKPLPLDPYDALRRQGRAPCRNALAEFIAKPSLSCSAYLMRVLRSAIPLRSVAGHHANPVY